MKIKIFSKKSVENTKKSLSKAIFFTEITYKDA